MPITWTNPEVLERLFLATLASIDNKVRLLPHYNSSQPPILINLLLQVNIREIATLYGGEMTYDALENRMRKFKKAATALKDESADRDDPPKSAAKPRAKKGSASPTKGGECCVSLDNKTDLLTKPTAVKTGRVTKKKAAAPPKIKPETLLEAENMLGIVEKDLDGGKDVIDEIEEV